MQMSHAVNSNTDQEASAQEAGMQPRWGFSFGGALVFLAGFAIICALVAFGALPRLNQQKELATITQQGLARAPAVSVTVAQPGPAVQEFTLPGTTQAIQDALIYARVSGYIHERYVDIGNRVHAGQVLASLDTPELDKQVLAAECAVAQAESNLENAGQMLAKSEADLKTAQANVRKARTDLNYYTTEDGRYKRLAGLGAVSQEDSDTHTQAYEAAASNLDALEASARAAQSGVRAAQAACRVAQAALKSAQAQRDQYKATQSFKKVTALFDGTVTQRNVDAGALVTAGSNSTNTALFEIARTDVLRIFVYVPEQFVGYMRDGVKVLLSFQEYPGESFSGTVIHVAGGLDPASKTLQVEVHVANASHRLLPGMYARARFQAPSKDRLSVLPATTVRTRADGCFVYTVDDRNVAHLHKIEIGRDLGGQFEIVAGVKAGDRAIVSPSDDIHDGLAVVPVRAAGAEKTDSK
jgi:RND family efflux transporter MFP subunit